MKKFIVILLSIILAIPFVGCNNKSEELNQQYEDAMSNGKSKVIEEEYDKAIDYFELALEYKKEDKEAMNLIEQLQLLEKTIEVEVDGSYFYQIKQLEKINSIDTETNVVKDKANEYKEIVIKNIDDAISDIENNIEDGKYKNSQEDLEEIIKECKEIDSLKDQLDRCNKLLDTCKEKKKEAEKQSKKEKEQREQQVYNNKKSSSNSDEFTRKDAKRMLESANNKVKEYDPSKNYDETKESYYTLSEEPVIMYGQKCYKCTLWDYIAEDDWWMHNILYVSEDGFM